MIGIVCLAVVAVLYGPTLAEMAVLWWHDTYAIHGLFVPLFSAHFLWIDREAVGKTLRERSRVEPIGGVLLGISFLGLALGTAWGSLLVRGWSLVATLAGLLWWRKGGPVLRQVSFPLAFLIMMVPLPREAVGAVTGYLQLFAAKFAALILTLLGIPHYASGIYIQLPEVTLEVAELCNGLRFMMALLVLTIAASQVFLIRWRSKVVLIAWTFPVAVLANATRVAVVAIASYSYGPVAASGFVHHTIGKFLWLTTLLPMGFITYLLRRREPKRCASSSEPAPLGTENRIRGAQGPDGDATESPEMSEIIDK